MDIILENTPQKQCTKCEKPFPATIDHFRPAKENRDGLENVCKTCRNKAQRGTYALHKESATDTPTELICTKCGQSKHFTLFRKSPIHRYGRHTQCEDCRKEVRNTLRSNPKVREREKETDKAWRQANPDKRYAIWRRYVETENGHVHCVTRTRNRFARQKAVKGTYTPAQIQDKLKAQHYRCYYAACGFAKFKRVKGQYVYEVEHTFPLARVAGTDIPANDISYLVLACPTCNRKKHDKFPHEFFEGGRLL